PLKIIATPLETLVINSYEDGIKKLLALFNDHDLEKIIMGYPIGTSGNKTEQTLLVEKLIKELKTSISTPIIIWDERYTSLQAKSIMQEQGIKTKNNKEMVDQLSARIMLQEYLNTI
ncbi:MAG: Holliday junction resolvase RuvX, partial [Candidatus Neomarinimicrobiota bacterium]